MVADGPCPDHEALHCGHPLENIVAYETHGDDGRGLKQSPVTVESWEVVVGYKTATKFWALYDADLASGLETDAERLAYAKMLMVEAMEVNFKGFFN